MQWWKKTISIFLCTMLVACAPSSGGPALTVRSASIDRGVLSANLQWQPDAMVLDALDHGISLDFTISVAAQSAAALGWHSNLLLTERHIQLRHFPLSQQYQWRDLDRDETRSYPARALLLAALENLRLEMPAQWSQVQAQRYEMNIWLDRDRLPGALRLPALFQSRWHISSGGFAWPATVAG